MRCRLLDNAKVNSCVLFLWTIVFIVGCAGPTLKSRVIQEESSWFVRLDSYETGGDSSHRYEHPATWTEQDLLAVLNRMLLEDRVGLMDSAQPPRAVFSTEELTFLVPAIKDSFQRATPREWISFFAAAPSPAGLAVSSGGLFLDKSQLHLVVANHRTLIANDSGDLAAVRENPFHSVRGSGGALAFESSRYVMGRQANWSGGHRASASELALDYRGFLSFLQRTGSVLTRPSPDEAVPLAPSSTSRSAVVTERETDSKGAILQLQEEIERLKRKVAEQEGEISRLKRER